MTSIGGSDFGAVRVAFRAADGTWQSLSPLPDLLTHDPQIYANGSDISVFLGHDSQIRFGYVRRPTGQLGWNPYQPLTTVAQGTLEGAASIRWDPLHETDPTVADAAFFDEDMNDNGALLAQVYYMEIPNPPAAAGDTTRPAVSITAPAPGTVSGTTTVSAGASDADGVAGVQFKVDGNNLGNEDTTAPYSVAWDTTAAGAGPHQLTAVAYDGAGNVATSAVVNVNIG